MFIDRGDIGIVVTTLTVRATQPTVAYIDKPTLCNNFPPQTNCAAEVEIRKGVGNNVDDGEQQATACRRRSRSYTCIIILTATTTTTITIILIVTNMIIHHGSDRGVEGEVTVT